MSTYAEWCTTVQWKKEEGGMSVSREWLTSTTKAINDTNNYLKLNGGGGIKGVINHYYQSHQLYQQLFKTKWNVCIGGGGGGIKGTIDQYYQSHQLYQQLFKTKWSVCLCVCGGG